MLKFKRWGTGKWLILRIFFDIYFFARTAFIFRKYGVHSAYISHTFSTTEAPLWPYDGKFQKKFKKIKKCQMAVDRGVVGYLKL